ncbi:MAG: small ribosomal subunit Rsm22 family protein [Clostridia bacterium]
MKYRENNGDGKQLLTTKSEAIAYSLARMPATFGAVMDVLKYTLELVDFQPKTLIDAGAGTGAVAWACNEQLNLESYICLEKENAMLETGKSLMLGNPGLDNKTEWRKFDLIVNDLPDRADIVVASYVLSELHEDDRIKVIEKLWHSTEKVLVIIGPGTPRSFDNLLILRNHMIKTGAKLVGPCPGQYPCPVSQIENDWCHFSCRVNRSKIHKQLKGGEAPFEDEKYMYFAFAREELCTRRISSRILRHPLIQSGYIKLNLCTKDGVMNKTVTKKDKEEYKVARKSKTGDSFD